MLFAPKSTEVDEKKPEEKPEEVEKKPEEK